MDKLQLISDFIVAVQTATKFWADDANKHKTVLEAIEATTFKETETDTAMLYTAIIALRPDNVEDDSYPTINFEMIKEADA